MDANSKIHVVFKSGISVTVDEFFKFLPPPDPISANMEY